MKTITINTIILIRRLPLKITTRREWPETENRRLETDSQDEYGVFVCKTFRWDCNSGVAQVMPLPPNNKQHGMS